ncbi:MAG: 2TM domain-containing protein [Thermoplasmata archaeon]
MSERRKEAGKLAVDRYEFLGHLAVYLLVNGGLVGIWAFEWLVEGVLDEFWPIYPIAIWGVFVLVHYLSVYGDRRRWIQRETARILRSQE